MAATLISLSTTDTESPWLQHLQPRLGSVLQHMATESDSVHAALNACNARAGSPCSLSFVGAHHLPKGMAYESFIFEHRAIPTRDNLHDLFGGLMWLHVPQLKLHLNALQQQEISRDGPQAKRSALRNAITLLDENGLLLDVDDAIWAALQARQWGMALHTLRTQWGQARLFVIGHGLLEQLCSKPHLGLTAHVLRVHLAQHQGDWSLAALSALQAQVLSALANSQKPYQPLPVHGIPGWHAGNTELSFYANSQIFRP